jgi:hypothetical protein
VTNFEIARIRSALKDAYQNHSAAIHAARLSRTAHRSSAGYRRKWAALALDAAAVYRARLRRIHASARRADPNWRALP